MITIENARNVMGERVDLAIPSAQQQTIDATGLTFLPALIDPHVHFRTPGLEHKEDWHTAAKAAIRGGFTTVFDMPNTLPPTITAELLKKKQEIIDKQLQEVGIPLRYHLFFGADKHHIAEIHKVKNEVIGIKIFMGCSTGNLVVDDDEALHAIFAIAGNQNMLVAVHAEDEDLMRERTKQLGTQSYSIHSQIRNEEVAARAVEKAISLARLYSVKLYILHVSTEDELSLIRRAKQERLAVYAEATPHHLFLDDSFYPALAGKGLMNPPLRAQHHQAALFAAIHDGTIDTIGSDHAPHTLTEKEKPYGSCPCGVPGIETVLPLLLTAHHEGRLLLHEIINLTSKRAEEIFQLPANEDFVLVDLNKEMVVDENKLKTKCGWSPFTGRTLRGWPVYTVLRKQIYDLEKI